MAAQEHQPELIVRNDVDEDVDVVERMQKGRQSPAFTGGAFSPRMDPPTHCFHKWLARAALKAI